MAIISFLLGVLSLLLGMASVPLTAFPYYAGAISSVLSVVAAVSGIVTGARANSRARENGEDTTFAIISLVFNSIMFAGGLCVTLTCGACNVLVSNSDGPSGFRMVGPDGSVRMYQIGEPMDGGVFGADPLTPDPQDVQNPLDQPAGDTAPSAPPADPNGAQVAPPPAMPPPPMDAPSPR